jgi:hypothetical protein
MERGTGVFGERLVAFSNDLTGLAIDDAFLVLISFAIYYSTELVPLAGLSVKVVASVCSNLNLFFPPGERCLNFFLSSNLATSSRCDTKVRLELPQLGHFDLLCRSSSDNLVPH